MYFSRLTPGGPLARDVAHWDLGRLHREVWRFFVLRPDVKRDFLFRLDLVADQPSLYLFSRRWPGPPPEGWNIETASYRPDPGVGEQLAFTVRVNPIRYRDGKRHDVVMDRKQQQPQWEATMSLAELVQEEGAIWLHHREQEMGAAIHRVRAFDYRVHRFYRKGRRSARPVSLATLELSGLLTVTDPTAFRKTLTGGLGRARGFGCGLLLLGAAEETWHCPTSSRFTQAGAYATAT